MSGKSFGDYRLARLLARGGMAEVYLAINERNSSIPRRLALKKILPVYDDLEEFTALFTEEGRLGQRLDHRNIVRVFDHGVVEGDHFLVMEYVDGPDLEKLLHASLKRGKQLPVQLILHIAASVCDALDYAHRATDSHGEPLQLVHRDISPPNILLGTDGVVKLTDFGVAYSASNFSQSRPGVVRGKYAYMSPEQIRGERVGRFSDIFSLGTVLYEMMTGTSPFRREGELQTMEAVAAADFRDPSSLRSGLPPSLIQLVGRCLAPRPEDRPARADAVRHSLSQLAGPGASEGAAGLLVDCLSDLFPHQMKRRVVASPSEDAVTQTLSEANPALRTMELGQWASDAADLMERSTAEFKFSLDDPRRVRLMGRADAVPPEPASGSMPVLLSSEYQIGDSLPPPAARDSDDDPVADPFQLGSVLEDGDDLALPESAEGGGQLAPSHEEARVAAYQPPRTLSMDDLKVARTGPLLTPDVSGRSYGSGDPLATMDAGREGWMEDAAGQRRSRLWLLPVAAGLFALSLVVLLGGPSEDLTRDPALVAELAEGEVESEKRGPGILVISSQPWAYVSVDGVMREWVTPTRLELSPGPHTIGLFHPATGWQVEREVEVRAGEELTLSVSR